MIAILKKKIRYGTRIFEAGEEGKIVDVLEGQRLRYNGKDIYDFYVEFSDHHPIGILAEEVEIKDGQEVQEGWKA